MSTVLVFVAIPLAVVAVIAALARTGSDRDRPTRRYRPGRPYEFAPIWFLSNPERVGPAPGGHTPELGGRTPSPAIEAGIIEDASGHRVLPGPVGGASDRW